MNDDLTFILADNQYITREGVRGIIPPLFGMCRIADVWNKGELVHALTDCRSCVVILDYALFDLNGVEELLIWEKRFPEVEWMIFSNELSEGFIRRLGAEEQISIVLKECSGEEMRSALEHAARGERYLCRQIADMLADASVVNESRPALTATEVEVLKLVAHGKSVKEIAAERCSSVHTIITHKKNIFRKLGINNVYEATRYALRAGLIEMADYYI